MRAPWRSARPEPEETLDPAAMGELDYRGRLDAALGVVAALAGRPDCYLYVAEAGGRRFHLEHTRARPAADPSRRAPGPMEQVMEGGAEWSVPTPAFEIVRSEADLPMRTVTTPVGRLWSLPLPAAADGLPAALVQVGPAPQDEVPKDVRRAWPEQSRRVGAVVVQARREEDLRQRLAVAEAQLDASQKLAGSALDVEQMMDLLLGLALTSTRTAAGFVAIQDAAGTLEINAQQGLPPDVAAGIDLDPESGLMDWSAAEGGALFLRDFETAERLGIQSLLAVPLVEDGVALGVFALVNFGEGGTFDDNSLELLAAFADQIRLMLHNARIFGSFTERYLETVEGLAVALDARQPESHGHHEAVAAVAVAVATAMELPPEEREAVELAGRIHDIGLAGSSDGAWDVDVEHPVVGASLVAHLPLHPHVAAAVATHHEWYDGWGFPRGLRGEDIPPAGRVLAVAEFLVEMTSPDPIRDALGPEPLAAELAQRRGSQFSPEVADAAGALLVQGALPFGVAQSAQDR